MHGRVRGRAEGPSSPGSPKMQIKKSYQYTCRHPFKVMKRARFLIILAEHRSSLPEPSKHRPISKLLSMSKFDVDFCKLQP